MKQKLFARFFHACPDIKMIYSFLIFLLVLFPSQGFSEAANLPAFSSQLNFNDKLSAAYAYASRGQREKSEKIFQDMLQSHPREYIVYEAYVQTLQIYEDYDRAIQILGQAEKQIPSLREKIESKLTELRAQRDFLKEMIAAPSWDKARIIASQEFVIQTNIPETYLPIVGEKIRNFLKKEKTMLAEILGPAESTMTDMKFIVIGRYPDYQAFMKEKYPQETRLPSGLYDVRTRQMIIYFNGTTNWDVIAHEMVHGLIRELYYQKPSRFVDEGLAQYISEKIEKESMKSWILDYLEYSKWLYNQGQFQDIFDFFTVWKEYEWPHSYKNFQKTKYQFYLIAENLSAFFLQTKDPTTRKFYRDYLIYEKSRGYNDWRSASDYFKKYLNAEQIKKLDKAWADFLFERTYETI